MSQDRAEDESNEWMEIVPPTPPPEADRLLSKWKADHPELAKDLRDKDIRTDIIRSIEGKTLLAHNIRRR